ncbi:UspA [Macleaya cordata]|uniref:UspA n=1 Tax=Macleaya cordata TaxID=56857 RepID=A0A200PPS5_MACCD|nr:UspA [Macleaya cordata]
MENTKRKDVIVVAFDDTAESMVALEHVLNFSAKKPFNKIVIALIQSPEQGSVACEEEVLTQKAKELCISKSVKDMPHFEVVNGDTMTVLCEIAKKHRARVLAVGGHYGGLAAGSGDLEGVALVNAAPCNVMIVPRNKYQSH